MTATDEERKQKLREKYQHLDQIAHKAAKYISRHFNHHGSCPMCHTFCDPLEGGEHEPHDEWCMGYHLVQLGYLTPWGDLPEGVKRRTDEDRTVR